MRDGLKVRRRGGFNESGRVGREEGTEAVEQRSRQRREKREKRSRRVGREKERRKQSIELNLTSRRLGAISNILGGEFCQLTLFRLGRYYQRKRKKREERIEETVKKSKRENESSKFAKEKSCLFGTLVKKTRERVLHCSCFSSHHL